MATLSALPVELLPLLFAPLQLYRQDLYNLCLVSRDFDHAARPVLYGWIRLFGKDLAKAHLVFRTLAQHEHLCRLIRRLEIRVFPLSLVLTERIDMEELASQVIRQSIHVRHLTWTRMGALTDRVLDAILTLEKLESFEINASTALKPGSWSADKLLDLVPLRTISLIMPDRIVANLLPDILKAQVQDRQRSKLRHLTVLCRESVVIHDALVTRCIPALAMTRLESLAFAGCIKLTGAPLIELLALLPSLKRLALEATSVGPSFYEQASHLVPQLLSLKLTHPGPRSSLTSAERFYSAVSLFLANKQELESFTLYYSGTASMNGVREWPTIDETFVRSVLTSSLRLKRFEVSGVLMRTDAFEAIAELAAQTLTDLVVHFGYSWKLGPVSDALARFERLTSLHILSQRPDVMNETDVLELVERSGKHLQQIGVRNRVWIVKRSFVQEEDDDDDDTAEAKVRIVPWDSPFWPEALLVVRT